MGKRKPRYELKSTANGQYHFVLIAPNGKIVLQSETYTTKQNALKGVETVRKYSDTLTIIDKT